MSLFVRSSFAAGLMGSLLVPSAVHAATPQAVAPAPKGASQAGANSGAGVMSASDKAVLEGLTWLARHQNPDGSWSPATLKDRCTTKDRCVAAGREYTHYNDVGVTGLAVQAFYGAKAVPGKGLVLADSLRSEPQNSADVARKALDWLIAKQAPDGRFGEGQGYVYNDAAATHALCLAYLRTHDEALREPAQRAVTFLANAQRPNPKGSGFWGWRYAPRQDIEKQYGISSRDAEQRRFGPAGGLGVPPKTERPEERERFMKELFDSDTSATANAIAALAAGRDAGFVIEPGVFAGASDYVAWVTTPEGLVGYNDPKVAGSPVSGKDDHYTYHVAIHSALSLTMQRTFGTSATDPLLGRLRGVVLRDVPKVSDDGLSVDYYYWRQGVRALDAFPAPDEDRTRCEAWKDAARDSILRLQDHTEGACSAGGWVFADRWCYSGGPVYATAFNVLTLEHMGAR